MNGRTGPETGRQDGGGDGEPVGDPVCWLPRVCHECGAIADSDPPTTCPRCGTPITGEPADG